MTTVMRVFLACTFGAFIGTLVALQVNQPFWWIGMLCGFATGYISCEFKRFVTAIPVAWRRATAWRWKPNKKFWRLYPKTVFGMWSILSTVALAALTLACLFSSSPYYFSGKSLLEFVLYTFFSSLFMGWVISDSAPMDMDIVLTIQKLTMFNPFRVYLWLLPRGIIICLWWIAFQGVPTFVRITGHFVRHLFLVTHSEVRLLCGFDAAIGAAVGYFCSSALIGAILGGVLGVLQFEILSIRVFGLVSRSKSLLK